MPTAPSPSDSRRSGAERAPLDAPLRTFRAASMPEALAKVKRELGPAAVILGTRAVEHDGPGRLLRRPHVEITAAPGTQPRDADSAPRPAEDQQPPTLPRHVLPYYTRLVQHEVAEELAARILSNVDSGLGGNAASSPAAVRTALRELVAKSVPTVGGIRLTEKQPRRVAFVGPTGAGKTTTLAKLAAHFRLRLNKRVAIVTLDTVRLAADQQLQRYAEIIGVAVHAAQTPEAVRQAMAETASADVVLIDTPGIGLRETERVRLLQGLLAAARPDEVHLVLPACLNLSSQLRAADAFAPLDVSRVVLTRLDDAVGLGVILNVMSRLQWRLSYVTDGQRVPSDIHEACGHRLASLLLDSEEI